jgi:hypothetical protein
MQTALHIIIGGTLITCLLFLITDQQCRRALKTRWKQICMILFLALVWRVPMQGRLFYGLEYEDSYVYTVAGRYLSTSAQSCGPASSCYLTTVCAVGNSHSCRIPETFSGHYIGYPFIIAVASRLIGYSPAIGIYLSFVAALSEVVLVFLACEMIEPGGIAGLVGSLIFTLTPVFAVNGVGAYSEPVSSSLVVLSFLLCFRLLNSNNRGSLSTLLLNWMALTFSALLAAAVKRENVLLIPVMVFAGLLLDTQNNDAQDGRKWLRYLMASGSCCLCFAFTIVQLQLFRTVRSETTEYAAFPFNLAVFRTMFPLFLKSYASVGWYLGGAVFVILGVVVSTQSRKHGIYAIALFAAYLLLYTSHVRSYYELQGGSASEFDTIRYSMNVAGLWSIIAGLGFGYLRILLTKGRVNALFRRHPRVIVWVGIVAYVLSSWALTSRLREDMIADEFAERLQPAVSALEVVGKLGTDRTYVITLEPLVLQMLSREPVNVIDFGYLNMTLAQSLAKDHPNITFLYVEQAIYASQADRERYGEGFDFVGRVHKVLLYRGDKYSIYQIEMS